MVNHEKRNYFRVPCSIFLEVTEATDLFARLRDFHSSSNHMDSLELLIHNFRDRLEYEDNPDNKELIILTDIIHLLYKNILNRTSSGPENSLVQYEKKEVILSGGSIEWRTDKLYIPNKLYSIQLGFPGYPFCQLSVQGRLVQTRKLSTNSNMNVVAFTFDNLKSNERDIIIRYVNHAQRQTFMKKKSS